MLWKQVLAVMVGGGLGATCRFMAGYCIHQYYGALTFPVATLVVNVLGCFVAGFIAAVLPTNSQSANELYRLLFLTGWCGGFTTFSAFSLEVIERSEARQSNVAFTYIVASVVLGLAAVWVGKWIGAHYKI